MILDNIKNCEFYFGLNSKFQAAFEFIQKAVADCYVVGKYEIDSDDLYASVQEYDTKPAKDAKFEGHRRYIDIQFMVSGAEAMKFADVSKMTAITEYNEEKDFELFEDHKKASLAILERGGFCHFLSPRYSHARHFTGWNPGSCQKDRRKGESIIPSSA